MIIINSFKNSLEVYNNMNTLKKRREHGQLQQQKASEIWDKQTDSSSQRGRSH